MKFHIKKNLILYKKLFLLNLVFKGLNKFHFISYPIYKLSQYLHVSLFTAVSHIITMQSHLSYSCGFNTIITVIKYDNIKIPYCN